MCFACRSTGHEGNLYAAAIAPTGDWVAVAGFTGLGVQQSSLLYVFDTSTGHLLGAVSHLGRTAVENLAFSPDGAVLAICLADGGGVLSIDWPNQRVISRSTEPRTRSSAPPSSPRGDFAMTTLDGWLWLY